MKRSVIEQNKVINKISSFSIRRTCRNELMFSEHTGPSSANNTPIPIK